MVAMLPMAACAGTQVAQDIVNWTPALQGAVATVDSTAALLAPVDAPIFAAATVGFDAASNELVAQAKAYLATPNATLLARLQTAVVTFEQTANTALLQAVKISDPASQKHVLIAIQGVSTIVTAIMALVQSISSKTAVAQMARASTIKLAAVRTRTWDERSIASVAAHYQEPAFVAAMQLSYGAGQLERAGF
jgi:hypothetical protein